MNKQAKVGISLSLLFMFLILLLVIEDIEAGIFVECLESDSGINPDVFGTVNSTLNGIFDDTCIEEPGQLQEYFCDEDRSAASTIIACEHGCLNGACIVPVDNDWCLGADVSKNGSVGIEDWSTIVEEWAREDCAISNNWCNDADITQDSYVDAGDVAVLFSHWFRTDCYDEPEE